MRLTVGPLPPAVYWRRRAVVLAIALLVLFVLFQACSAGGSSSGEPSSDDDPAATDQTPGGDEDEPDGEETGERDAGDEGSEPADGSDGDGSGGQREPDVAAGPPVGGDFCGDDEIAVRAEAARTELTAGESVRFTIAIGNDSGRTCRRDVGGDERELYLRHVDGANVVWSSRDCGGPTGTDERDLPSPIEMDWYIEWNGQASNSCEGVVPAGGPVEPGEYYLFSRLGTAHSEPLLITVD